MTKQYMIDIESLGKQPGGVILSIGWVRFNLEGVLMSTAKEVRIDIRSSLEQGFYTDPETINWWLEQEASPWHHSTKTVALNEALTELCADLSSSYVWAKPPSYDLEAIHYALSCVGIGRTWSRANEFCLRTLSKLMRPHVSSPPRKSVKHGALDDAIFQAEQAVVFLNAIKENKQ